MSPGFNNWYRGRRVLLTGHTGFKGSWLTIWLNDLGAEVLGYSLAPEPQSLFRAAGLDECTNSVIADLRDRSRLAETIKRFQPEIIIHMAAQSLVRLSYEDPVETFGTNVLGTVNLLDSAREVGSVRSIVIVSSDKCYKNVGGSEPFTENSPMGGHDPYSASKGCTELVAASFRRSFFFEGACALATARAGNVIGGGDWAADRIIPDVMRAAYTSTPVFIRRPDAVRPWQHVLEPLRGYLMLARGLAGDRRFAGGWNFGPSIEDTCSVRKVVEKVTALWPGIEVEFAEEPFGPHEAGSLMLDCTKARRQLDWRPVLSIDDMLASTIEWYRETRDHPHRAMGISLQQIRSFEAQCQRSPGVQSA